MNNRLLTGIAIFRPPANAKRGSKSTAILFPPEIGKIGSDVESYVYLGIQLHIE
jgi:hypothetical protein